ncbi:MAG TPA: M20 family metallopeptidase [bacterium]|nr:M20 family metallopeptidase [bacterium]
MKEDLTGQLADITCKLVSFQTTEDKPQEVEKAYSYIKGFLKGCNVSIKEYEKEGKRSLVIHHGRQKDKKNFKIIFLCHIDVVPARKELFVPRVSGGRIYGRGAYDMKAGCAVGLMLMKNVNSGDFAVIYTSDEEIGGKNGTAFLVDKGYRADFVIALESTDCKVVSERKGVLRIIVSSKGKSVHSSVPWEGVNALDKLISAYMEIRKKFPSITSGSSEKEKFQKTLNLALVKGGDVFNKVPDDAYMYLDVRYSRRDSPKEILSFIKKISKKHKCMVTSAWQTPTLFTSEKNEYLQKLVKIGKCKITRRHGASDCRYFSRIGVPAVDMGAKGRYHHGDGEYLEINSLKRVYDMLEKFLNDI